MKDTEILRIIDERIAQCERMRNSAKDRHPYDIEMASAIYWEWETSRLELVDLKRELESKIYEEIDFQLRNSVDVYVD